MVRHLFSLRPHAFPQFVQQYQRHSWSESQLATACCDNGDKKESRWFISLSKVTSLSSRRSRPSLYWRMSGSLGTNGSSSLEKYEPALGSSGGSIQKIDSDGNSSTIKPSKQLPWPTPKRSVAIFHPIQIKQDDCQLSTNGICPTVPMVLSQHMRADCSSSGSGNN